MKKLNNYIFLILFFIVSNAFTQNSTALIRGSVYEEGVPLPGATIMIKNTQIGAVTDFDGYFEIKNVKSGTYQLLITLIGYEVKSLSIEVPISGELNLGIINLKPSAESLNEVVITALGMKREKKALGYSVGEVDSEKVNLVPQENVMSSLSSKISGLDIRRSGNDLNAETHVYIRGRTSLTGNDDPLVIIDGAPVGGTNAMSDISAVNIKNITVLKGASAAALYGSRAGNGVIIVTTKSGEGLKKGIGVSISSSVTFNTPYKYMDLQNRFTNGKKGLFNESTWQHWYGSEEGTEAVQWNTDGEAKPLKFYQNSLEDFFKTGISTINDVSVQGANDKGSFRLSMSHQKATGNFPGSELEKVVFNLAASTNITDKVKLSTNINISNPKSDNFPVLADGRDDQYFDIFNIAPHININDLKDDYWKVKNVEQRRVTSGYNNPWWSAKEKQNKFDRVRGFGNVKLDYEITPELKAFVRGAYSSLNSREETLKPWSYDGFSRAPRPFGSYNVNTSDRREYNVDFLLNHDKQLGDFHINTSIGGNIMSRRTSKISLGGDNLVLPGLFTASNVSRGGLNYDTATFDKSIYSIYGMTSLSYRNIAFIDITGRNDWSSTLPKENRSYFYPSVSTSLLISKMMNLPDWVSLIKLRSGWAEVGKDTEPYLINPTLDQSSWGDDLTYSLPSSMPNTNLKPEIATSYEIGTDISLFNNRLGFEATYYKTVNKNQILNVGISPLTGYTSTTINAGSVENKGIEIGVNMVPIRTKDLEWNLNMTFTKASSKLVELVSGVDRVSFGGGSGMYAFTEVGGTIGDLYSYGIEKVEEGEYKGWNKLDSNGRLKIIKNVEDRPLVGNFTNDFSMGLSTSVSYKNFTISASFDWRQGGDFFSESMKRMARSGKVENWHNGISSSTFSGALDNNSFNGDRDQLANEIRTNPIYRDNDVWIGGRNEELGGFQYNGNNNGAFFAGVIDNGDGTYTENFGAAGTKMFDAYRVVESSGSFWRTGYAFMYDASFVKMRDITLTYKFTDKVVKYISAQNISISVFAKNLMLWTKNDAGIDPEIAHHNGNQGFEKWNLGPQTAPIGFKLNIEF